MPDPSCAAGCGKPIDLSRPHVTLVQQVERLERDGTFDVLHAVVVARRHQECTGHDQPTAPLCNGMVVDGDVLRDVIADAVPRWLTDDAAATIAADALDLATRAGMFVLNGPGRRHRRVDPPAAAPAPPAGPSAAAPPPSFAPGSRKPGP